MKSHGFTLFELLITLLVICVILVVGIPSFTKQVSESRTKTATLALLDAIETARATAVFRNQHVVLSSTNKKWHDGWTLFVDKNANGALDDGDEALNVNQGLDAVISHSATPMNAYVAFVGSGEGRQVGAGGRGGFLSGTIKICPTIAGEGYSLVLSKGGRTRVGKLSKAECDGIR